MNIPGYPDGSTHWRRLTFWQRQEGLSHVWELLLKLLNQQRQIGLDTLALDGTLAQSFAFKDTTGYSGKHHRTGVKVSVLSDTTGIPLSLELAGGNRNDQALAKATITNIHLFRGIHKHSLLLADKGYDGLSLRQFLFQRQVHPNIPKRKSVKVKKKHTFLYVYFPHLGKGRYVIERTNAWLKSFRRLRMRFDYKAASFAAFLYLAILVICVRRLLP